jgi:hypothetical protein
VQKKRIDEKKRLFIFSFFLWVLQLNAQSNIQQATTATAGKLVVAFLTNAGSSNGTAMAMSIYITDSSGKLVNTLLYRTSNGDSSAKDMSSWWTAIGSAWNSTKTLVTSDAITGATRGSGMYYTNQIVYWGNNYNVSNVADGTYTVNFECANFSSVSRRYYSGTFVKGPNASNSTVTASLGFSGISITWTPVNTAIEDVEFSKLYKVYPNPAITSIYASGNDIKLVQICSLKGKILLTSKEQNINLTSLTKGFYLAVIYTEVGMVVKKFEKL